MEHTFDLTCPSLTSIDRNASFSAAVDTLQRSQAYNAPISSSSINQILTIRDRECAVRPHVDCDDFPGRDSLDSFITFEELTEDDLSSYLHDNPANHLQTDFIGNLLPEVSRGPTSYPFKICPLDQWVEDWPVKDLDDRRWTELASIKALSRPDLGIVHRLLRLYFQYINPRLPVLSERDIYHLIHPELRSEGIQPNSISLALLNAIMFAASSVSALLLVAITYNF